MLISGGRVFEQSVATLVLWFVRDLKRLLSESCLLLCHSSLSYGVAGDPSSKWFCVLNKQRLMPILFKMS